MIKGTTLVEQLLLLIASFIANTFSAFSGGGAGLIQFPLLIFLGLPFSLALATHKVASVALGVGACLRHARERNLWLRISLLMVVAGVPGVLIGALLIVHVPDWAATKALGVLTLGLGLYSVFKPKLGQEVRVVESTSRHLLIGAAGLFVIGVLNGSLTSGTGLFATMWLVRWFGLDYKRAVAHTLVWVGTLWNGSGALTLGLISDIHWPWLPALLAGSLLGGYAGAHLAITKGSGWIKRAFEVITLITGVMLLLK
ncbi:MAG: sulfite exporter TauE/SafE family protein [Gammaproteobacteria bacterium]|nr:sulfite exporter TauE/SafE family protein [Gammaproteobacteria bacterium]